MIRRCYVDGMFSSSFFSLSFIFLLRDGMGEISPFGGWSEKEMLCVVLPTLYVFSSNFNADEDTYESRPINFSIQPFSATFFYCHG